jgi:hypothetical protein
MNIKNLDLIRIYINQDLSIGFSLNLILIVILGIAFLLFLAIRAIVRRGKKTLEIDAVSLGIGSHTIQLRPNYTDMQVAYKLWIEINTRKIALPLDYENDVIVEIYRSWYEFFKVARELLKEIPVRKVRSESTGKIINIALEILNEDLRIHLTKWQAKYQKWYSSQLLSEDLKNLDPQVIQRTYPFYDELFHDLVEVNNKLIKYKLLLEKIYT